MKKVNKPARPSRSLKTVKRKAGEREWVAMATFKPADANNEERSNDYQRFLVGLLRRELRGKGIGFLLVREFGTGKGTNDRPDASHFHVVLTARLSDDTKAKLQSAFLRRCCLPNNATKVFHYTNHVKEGKPTFGDYVSKLEKGKIDVIHPPASWDYRKLIRCYHHGFPGFKLLS